MNQHEPIRPDECASLFEAWGRYFGKPCALAVSGGSDSTALMVLFADWLRQSNREAALHTVLTVDHALRPQSADEARSVAERAAALGFGHATLRWDGPKSQTGIQAAARATRYRLIADYMRANKIDLVLTGHTRDDQAETLLMRLARGSGVDGLAGIGPHVRFSDLGCGHPSAADPEIARPLLGVPRARLRATLELRGIGWSEDPSNEAMEFERPRLRAARAQLEALGLTEGMLALSAARLQRARRALDGAADWLCSKEAGVVDADACGYVTIDRHRLQEAAEEIAVRVLGRAIAAAGGSSEPVPLAKLEAIVAAVQGNGDSTQTWTLARAIVTATGPQVFVEREVGRKPLHALKLESGAQALWDGRFWVKAAAAADVTDIFEVQALGKAAARKLRGQGAFAADISVRVASLVPSFWLEGELVAVPSLDLWVPPCRRGDLDARFAGEETIRGTSSRTRGTNGPK